MSNDNQLQVVIEQSGLETGRVKELLSHFGQDFQQARELVEKVKDIKVSGEDDKKAMGEARKARLQLRDIRLQVENTRKGLKEQSLREGKAIDGAANIIKALIVPVEEYLEKQEKYAEEMERKRQEERLEKRRAQLLQYVDDVSVYDLVNPTDEAFAKLLESAKAAKDAQIAAEKKAEEERLEQQRKEKLHFTRKDQLIPYWIFLKDGQAGMDFGQLEEKDFLVILNDAKAAQKADAEKRVKEARKAEELRKQQEKKDEELRKANEAKEKAEKELRDKKDAEEKAKQAEAERIAKEKAEAVEAERQKLLAPDREKLLALAKEIKNIPLPRVESEKAKKAILDISGMLGRLDEFIKQRAQTL